MAKDFKEVVQARRSIYALGNEKVVSEADIEAIVNFAFTHTPTAFNAQEFRGVVLFGEHHEKLWEIVRETLRPLVPADAFASTDKKLDGFKAGYGTVLFFTDTAVVTGLQEKFDLYKDNFPIWANENIGAVQFLVWTLLEEAGLGANLQHYNPLINGEVNKTFGLPENWTLMAQMPFGSVLAPAGEKQFLPLDQKVLVIK